jgi:hypothetical protein
MQKSENRMARAEKRVETETLIKFKPVEKVL